MQDELGELSGHGHPVAGLPPEPHRQVFDLHGLIPDSVSGHQGLTFVSLPSRKLFPAEQVFRQILGPAPCKFYLK